MATNPQITIRAPEEIVAWLDESLGEFENRNAKILDVLKRTKRKEDSDHDLRMFLTVESFAEPSEEAQQDQEWPRPCEAHSNDVSAHVLLRVGEASMRPIHMARIDGVVRPVLVLTRGGRTIGLARKVTVAVITSTIHDLATELSVGPKNGLDQDCVVDLADIRTINQADLEPDRVGVLRPSHERALREAVAAAFELAE